jgi:hypothetical protein
MKLRDYKEEHGQVIIPSYISEIGLHCSFMKINQDI